jgi:uncharacterized membrane protein YqjE
MGESAQATINRRRDAIPSSGANLGPNGARERSMSEVLKDIIDTVQKIVRGEVRLAKAEVRDEAAKAWKSGRRLLIGSVVGLFAAAFLLLGIVYALTLAIPAWAAAGSVGLVLAIAAGIAISQGANQMKQAYKAPERIVETIKESLE